MMTNIFTQHPKELSETYLEHGFKSMKYSLTFFYLFLVAFSHALFPFMFKSTVSNKIVKMSNNILSRKRTS